METKDTTYNGWRNYETWCVALWIDNEQGSQEYVNGLARDCAELTLEELDPAEFLREHYARDPANVEAGKRHRLADALKRYVEEDLCPDLGASMAADLLQAALDSVAWDDVAHHYMDTVLETA